MVGYSSSSGIENITFLASKNNNMKPVWLRKLTLHTNREVLHTQQRVLAYQQRSSTTLTITITNSIFRHMKFTTVFYYEFFNNTFIVKEITLIHKMSLACNYLLLLIVLSSTKYDITWCHLFNYKELTYSRFS